MLTAVQLTQLPIDLGRTLQITRAHKAVQRPYIRQAGLARIALNVLRAAHLLQRPRCSRRVVMLLVKTQRPPEAVQGPVRLTYTHLNVA
ncbi:hypothetical protein GCM10022406_41100 [Hymenobacter algoricola]|uniref:Uncharacterized protein n=1 Tax=Hymenobacter algoricola TaxID=486267 RepID=A0ABP7NWH6_9BACT